MSVINLLTPHVADLIAAGEVVERPASVIKELLENAFDAGANQIICEIRNGGTTYIRVTDNGCGMAPEDAGIAFLRHATSKLADEDGLACISTMGFRGEALAAISSVSRMELLTRQPGAPAGTRVLLEAGDIQEMEECGCPEGTTMICRDLFYHTPARLKFLKSDRSEASACIAAALRCALGRPDVSVRLIRDGSEEFFTPGDGKISSALYTLLGREESASMLRCTSSSGSMKLDGFISSPAEGRGNRAHQFFFVNSRTIHSALLQSALEQAHKNTLLVGRYPSCALFLTLPVNSVDVNVHPAKTEIRFGNEKAVFDFVYQAVKLALASEDRLAAVPKEEHAPAPAAAFQQKKDFYQTMSAAEYQRQSRDFSVAALHSPAPAYTPQLRMDLSPGSTREAVRPSPQSVPESPVSVPAAQIVREVEKPVQSAEKGAFPDHKILGEAFRTFIIVEQNDTIILIDKHAAHERMIFDRLKAAGREIPSQMLLVPSIVRLSLEDAEVILQNGALLTDLGFEIEPYGEMEFIVRGVPAEMNVSDVPAAIEEICETLRSGKTVDPAEVQDEILHTVACKAAIKAGWDTQRPELEKIVVAVLSGEIRYCPHGRPVSALVTHKDLDRLFKRIV